MPEPSEHESPLTSIRNPVLRLGAHGWFAIRRGYYRARYPRMRIGPGVIFAGRLRLGQGTRLVLGAHVLIRKSTLVDGGGEVTIGAHTRINGACWIGAHERVSIGDWCLISDCVIFDSDFHNVAPRERHLALRAQGTVPVWIGRNVWVGTRAVVGKGSTIGDDSVVGAGAVVRGEVPAGVVVIGNPAVVVKTFDADERSAAPPARVWWP